MKHDACKKGIEIIVASKGKCAKGTSFNHFYQFSNKAIKFNQILWTTCKPFKRQPHKMVKHTQTIRRQFVNKLFECV